MGVWTYSQIKFQWSHTWPVLSSSSAAWDLGPDEAGSPGLGVVGYRRVHHVGQGVGVDADLEGRGAVLNRRERDMLKV